MYGFLLLAAGAYLIVTEILGEKGTKKEVTHGKRKQNDRSGGGGTHVDSKHNASEKLNRGGGVGAIDLNINVKGGDSDGNDKRTVRKGQSGTAGRRAGDSDGGKQNRAGGSRETKIKAAKKKVKAIKAKRGVKK